MIGESSAGPIAPYRKTHKQMPKETSDDKPSEKMRANDLRAFYGQTRALHGITLSIASERVTALIGPSGCGKSTFLRCLNRMHEVIPGARATGTVTLDGENIYGETVDPVLVRRRVGMVF